MKGSRRRRRRGHYWKDLDPNEVKVSWTPGGVE